VFSYGFINQIGMFAHAQPFKHLLHVGMHHDVIVHYLVHFCNI
jgi:hypothetical protein